MKYKILFLLPLLWSARLSLTAQAASQGLARPLEGSRAELFPLSDVRITGGQMLTIQELSHKYLLTLEPDRLLSWFRREAGLTPLAQPYPQWESVIHDECR